MNERTFLKFSTGPAIFGLPVVEVIETIRIVAFSPIPSPSPDVLGVINVRGRIIPVYDLCRTLNLGDRPLTLRMYIVIANVENEEIGILVDDVLDVVTVPSEQFQVPRSLSGGDSFTAGVVRAGSDLLTVLNLRPLLGRAHAAPPSP